MASSQTAAKLEDVAGINRETINDVAKLIMHRLIAWRMTADPSLVQRARLANSNASGPYEGYSFIAEWDAILALPLADIRKKLAARNSTMSRLRSASPFVGTGIGLTDYDRRIRIGRAAKRLVMRRLSRSPAAAAELS